jgi:hypothetical protein
MNVSFQVSKKITVSVEGESVLDVVEKIATLKRFFLTMLVENVRVRILRIVFDLLLRVRNLLNIQSFSVGHVELN